MHGEEIKISVIIPTRNRAELLARAVKSVRQQSWRNYEIVIIDNFSDIPVSDIVFFRSADIKIVRNSSIFTAGANRNIGIDFSHGDLVCFLDDDDEYYLTKFRDIVEIFDINEDVDFVFGNTDQIGNDGRVVFQSRGPCDIHMYLKYRHIHLNSLAVRRRVLSKVRFLEDMEKYQDVEFIGRVVRLFRGFHVDCTHAAWYRDGRPDQVTRRNIKLGFKCWKKLCNTFDNEIRSYPDLKKMYFDKMIYFCLLNFNFRDLIKYTYLRTY
jgi:glycosyltransferase involved in cell wall biosynthesis